MSKLYNNPLLLFNIFSMSTVINIKILIINKFNKKIYID